MPVSPQIHPAAAIAAFIGFFFIAGLALYIYFGITLMVIAKKTNTGSPGLAWLPIGNLFLMCSIGRRPGWWVLLLPFPLVNVIVAAMIWMGMAEARGKPAWAGALALLPGIGLIIPAYLSAGPATNPDLVPARACGFCGAAATGDDAFCGECGKPLPVSRPPMPAGKLALAGLTMVLVLGAATLGAGWLTFGRGLAYTPPKRQPPAMPQRMAGTLTEFPIDTDPQSPARPSSIVSQTFSSTNGSTPTVQVPQTLLPPGLPRTDLPQHATAATTAAYRTRPGKKPLGVTVLSTRGPARVSGGRGSRAATSEPGGERRSAGQTIAPAVALATGGEQAGVRVQSPSGATYEGTRIRSPQVLVYILDKVGENITIIIYAPDPEDAEIARRLAGNVGNGAGITDDPNMQGAIGTLPSATPGDLTLETVNTLTPADLGVSEVDLKTASQRAARDSEEAQRMMRAIQQFIPERLTTAVYRDGEHREWDALECDFGGTRRAWNSWWLLKWTLAASGMHATPVSGGEGQYAEADKQRILIFQKGPYLVFLSAPKAAPLEKQTRWADAFQM